MQVEPALRRRLSLATVPADGGHRRLALAMVIVSSVIFLAAVPFAKLPLAQVPAFVATYQSALVLCDLITAVLLFGHLRFLPSRALLVLACGYLYTATLAFLQMLTFPGVFAPSGLLGAGSQTTAWMYMFWHGGFPLFVVAFALLRKEDTAARGRGLAARTILGGAVATLTLVCALTLVATAGRDYLPSVIVGIHYTPSMIFVASTVWLLSVLALAVLWRRRPHSVLEVWLMVVMCAWIFDIGLGAVVNSGRYDLGFYAARIYALLAASFVLGVLLLENGSLYAQLVETHDNHAKRLQILREIDTAVAAEQSPDTIAAAAIQPLREVLGVARVVVNIFDLAAGEVEWLAAAGRHRTHVGPGVRYSIQLMGDVEALKRGEPQVVDTHLLPAGPEQDALLASGIHVYLVMPMIAGGELIGAVSFGGATREFPAEQVSVAQEVATQFAIAIVQARLYGRVKQHADELESRVRERTSELQAANEELESFSYSVSHDLRAPLRAIDGYSKLLEENCKGKLDPEGQRFLRVIRKSGQKMGALIDDLLAFSRLGRAPMATLPVNMNGLVQEVLQDLQVSEAENPPQIAVETLPPAYGDRALLRQVWTNLLANAVKFSRENHHPVIEVGARKGGAETVYTIRDNGAGFDMRYYDKLFGVFQRLHSNDEFPGTGVGLAIVQRVVTRHGGRVWAEGKPREGATFYFALPAARAGGREAAG